MPFPPRGSESNATSGQREGKSRCRWPAGELARLALESEPRPELFHTPGADSIPYATIAVDGHLETWPIHSTIFRHALQRRVYQVTGTLPRAHVTQAALSALAGQALFDGPERPVVTRLAAHEMPSISTLATRPGRPSQSRAAAGVS